MTVAPCPGTWAWRRSKNLSTVPLRWTEASREGGATTPDDSHEAQKEDAAPPENSSAKGKPRFGDGPAKLWEQYRAPPAPREQTMDAPAGMPWQYTLVPNAAEQDGPVWYGLEDRRLTRHSCPPPGYPLSVTRCQVQLEENHLEERTVQLKSFKSELQHNQEKKMN